MIQLATEPTASRTSYRPAQGEDQPKAATLETRRGRSGHPWPFLSRYAARPAEPNSRKSTGTESGS
jgi:hypothetical protein